MLVLLGQNNHGKSNIISALDFALNSSVKPDKEDLCAFAEPDDKTIWVEVAFDRLTVQEETTWRKYVRGNGTFCFRKTATFNDEGKIDIKYNGYVSEPEEEWLRTQNAGDYTSRKSVSETPLKSYIPESGRLSKTLIEEAQLEYIEKHRAELNFSESLEKRPLLGQKNVAAGVLPRFFLVPAVRDLSDESKVKSTALLGKLLTYAVTEMASEDSRFGIIEKGIGELIDALNAGPGSEDRPQQLIDLESSIEQELSGWNNVQVSLEVTPPDISKIFELGTDIHLDDGLKTLANRKGHGLQRAVIFALMKAWSNVMICRDTETSAATTARRASDSVIFAIEEPELFLHPHAQRDLDKALRVLSQKDNSQVFVCSHSTHFVNLDYYRGIALIRKISADKGTTLVQCTEDLFEDESQRKRRFNMATWVNPDRGEMLFARRVAFVEGETEKSVFPFLAKKLGCYSEDVSVIDCGSKHNILLYVYIARAFQLNYVVVHDEDPLPDQIPKDWDSVKRKSRENTFKLNTKIKNLVGDSGSVIVLSPDFEACGRVSKSQGQKIGKPLAALDHFDKVGAGAIPSELADTIRKVYKADTI